VASTVDICNLALGYLGDTATVSSLNPPDGSAQAQHCARFYPIARTSIEMNAAGQQIILTNVCAAVIRYTFDVSDTTKFSGLFTQALAWLLASMLAGPLLKGDAGAAESKRCLQMFQMIEAQAESSDANQRNVKPQIATPWIVGR